MTEKGRVIYEQGQWIPRLMAVTYIILSFLSFYSECYKLPVGVKYFVNLIIAFWAAAAFFISPRFKEMTFCFKTFIIYALPFLFFWMWSVGIWVSDFQTVDYIIRGSKNVIYMFTNIAYVCAAYYLFGHKAIYYTFYAMFIANIIVFFEAGLNWGFGRLLSEYITLVTSFANVTGEAIGSLEIHGMVHGWGLFLIYFIMNWEKPSWKHILYILTAFFFFTLAFKRIGIIGAAMALVLGMIYRRIGDGGRRGMTTLTAVIITVVAFAYIVAIKTGTFEILSQEYGINLMGRDEILEAYDEYYEISPAFAGHGIRFVFNHGQTTGGYSSLHNVFVEHYIELGFIGWFVWMIYDTFFRLKYFERNYGTRSAVFLYASTIFIFMTYATDNTYFYFVINVIFRLLSMAWCYENKDPAVEESVVEPYSWINRLLGG